MQIQFVVCSQSISIDQASYRLSFFNVLDHLNVPAFPVWIPEITVVASVVRSQSDPVEARGGLQVHLDEQLLARDGILLNFNRGPIARMVFVLSGIAILSTGQLNFRVNVAGAEEKVLSIPVGRVGSHDLEPAARSDNSAAPA